MEQNFSQPLYYTLKRLGDNEKALPLLITCFLHQLDDTKILTFI